MVWQIGRLRGGQRAKLALAGLLDDGGGRGLRGTGRVCACA